MEGFVDPCDVAMAGAWERVGVVGPLPIASMRWAMLVNRSESEKVGADCTLPNKEGFPVAVEGNGAGLIGMGRSRAGERPATDGVVALEEGAPRFGPEGGAARDSPAALQGSDTTLMSGLACRGIAAWEGAGVAVDSLPPEVTANWWKEGGPAAICEEGGSSECQFS